MTERKATEARPRNAAATREAILAAARVAFTRDGYDGAGVREIAAAAGANQALVNRYFGSKEKLFTEAVASAFSIVELLPDTQEGFAQAIARYVLTKPKKQNGEFDPTLAMLRSAGNADAAELMKAGMDRDFVRPLAEWLGGEHAEQRAAMFVSVLAGLSVMRDVLRISALQTDEDVLVNILSALLAAALKP
ncbi:TetR family transcriptional regulator [Nostoc sp. NIES-2111]